MCMMKTPCPFLTSDYLHPSQWHHSSGKLPVLDARASIANSDAECSHAPVLISRSSTQTLAVLHFLYCSTSFALATFSSGHQKFLIQASDGELRLTLLFAGGKKKPPGCGWCASKSTISFNKHILNREVTTCATVVLNLRVASTNVLLRHKDMLHENMFCSQIRYVAHFMHFMAF